MKIDNVRVVTGYRGDEDFQHEINAVIDFEVEEHESIAVGIIYQTSCPTEDSIVHSAIIMFTDNSEPQ